MRWSVQHNAKGSKLKETIQYLVKCISPPRCCHQMKRGILLKPADSKFGSTQGLQTKITTISGYFKAPLKLLNTNLIGAI